MEGSLFRAEPKFEGFDDGVGEGVSLLFLHVHGRCSSSSSSKEGGFWKEWSSSSRRELTRSDSKWEKSGEYRGVKIMLTGFFFFEWGRSMVYVEGEASMRKFTNSENREQQALSIVQREPSTLSMLHRDLQLEARI